MAVTPTLVRSNYVGEIVPGYVDVDGTTVIAASAATPMPVSSPGSSPTNPNANPATVNFGQVALAANTRVQLPALTLINGALIKCKSTNTADVLFGGSTVTIVEDGTGNGFFVEPGAYLPGQGVTNLNTIYAICSAAAVICWTGN